MKKSLSGFTIVELLIVIVVIAILAAITVVAYNGVQNRANAASVSTALKNIDKSLRAYSVDKGWTTWPLDTGATTGILPTGSNPSIQRLINELPGFNQYMQTAPSIGDVPAASWTYDNDGNTKLACNPTDPPKYNGTNIVLTGITDAVAQNIDSAIDDGDLNCQKIQYDPTADKLFYTLSFSNIL